MMIVSPTKIDGLQCTISWNVKNLKISHVESKVVENIIDGMKKKYGKEAPLTVIRGKVHGYLGTTIDFSTSENLVIQMDDYVKKLLEEAREYMTDMKTSPAALHIFEVSDIPKMLENNTKKYFHKMTTKLLFLS